MDAFAFQRAAKALQDEVRRRDDLTVSPAFRSPPRDPRTTRAVRRAPNGVVVSVALRDREPADVAIDMAAGVAVANGLDPDGPVADALAAVALDAAQLVDA